MTQKRSSRKRRSHGSTFRPGSTRLPIRFPSIDPDAFTRLPSAQTVLDLERIAARAYGVDRPGRVVAAPGSQTLIELLPRLRPKGRVAIVGPTYNEHAACWQRQGHACPSSTRSPPPLSGRPDVIVLVNPNNPDGRVVPAAELEQAAATLRKRGGWLVIDEAFADLEEGVSVAHRNLPATIILRSFGKTYGLAGSQAWLRHRAARIEREHPWRSRLVVDFRAGAGDRSRGACRFLMDHRPGAGASPGRHRTSMACS